MVHKHITKNGRRLVHTQITPMARYASNLWLHSELHLQQQHHLPCAEEDMGRKAAASSIFRTQNLELTPVSGYYSWCHIRFQHPPPTPTAAASRLPAGARTQNTKNDNERWFKLRCLKPDACDSHLSHQGKHAHHSLKSPMRATVAVRVEDALSPLSSCSSTKSLGHHVFRCSSLLQHGRVLLS